MKDKLNANTLNYKTGKDLVKLKLQKRVSGGHFVPPINARQEKLVSLWQEILNIDSIGIEEDFFKISGDSIKGIQLIARIDKLFGIRISLTEIFENPTIASLDELLERKHRNKESHLPVISTDLENALEAFPLTPIQQAYWVGRLNMFELGNISTSIYTEDDFTDLDVGRFNIAVQKLIHRHGMLRAVVTEDGEQCILKNIPNYEAKLQDFTSYSPEALDAAILRIRHEMTHHIPVAGGALYDIRISLLPHRKSRVHIAIDMIIADALSLTILQNEFWLLYNNPDHPLMPLSISFRDYVLAELKFQKSDLYNQSKAYWLNRINELPSSPELPVFSVGKNPSYINFSSHLPSDSWARLKSISTASGFTPTAFLLGVYAEILATWSKNKAFTINLTTSNRMDIHHEVNHLVGDFTSVILLAVKMEKNRTFQERLKQLQSQLWNDLEHRYFSGVEVIRELSRGNSETARAHMPIVFTSTLALGSENTDQDIRLPSERVFIHTPTSQVWLDHQVAESNGELQFTWTVVDKLFPDGMIEDMFAAYCNLLNEFCGNTDLWNKKRLPCLPEKHIRLVESVNATGQTFTEENLISAIERQTKITPDKIALISQDQNITYRELDFRSEKICGCLQSGHVKRNSLVAVLLDKSLEQIIAVLGILKSGAAYLPIEAQHPQERIIYLLENGEVQQIISKHSIAERLPEEWKTRTIFIDNYVSAKDIESAPRSKPHPDDLAYVIFTSGSTGRPKGVMIDHKGAVNTIQDINSRFNISPEDKILSVSSLNFDLSVYDVFGILSAGGALVMPAYSSVPNPEHWLDLIRSERITLWNSVPALMEVMIRSVERSSALRTLRLAMLSGDWIPVTLPALIKAHNPNVKVTSLGGATEASIWSILFTIDQVEASWKSIPYGKPLLNQQVYVYDEFMDLCPVWVPGQIYIGGIGVAKGYWRDHEKTAKQFISDLRTGKTLYKTGDLGRYLPDGNIEFLGREDSQIKINGYRIELGEIESTLYRHLFVRDAAVIVHTVSQARHLIAFICLREEISLSMSADQTIADQLKAYLQEQLPTYMVPWRIHIIGQMPLTANGKIDRNALSLAVSSTKTLFEEPSHQASDKEGALQEIFSTILGLERVSRNDNFFDAGGNSLLATRVIAAIHKRFNIRLDFRSLFNAPTPAHLSKVIDQSQQEQYCKIKPVEEQEYYSTSEGQKRLWLLDKLQESSIAYHLQEAYELVGRVNVSVFIKSFNLLIQRHAVLRTRFFSLNDDIKQKITDFSSILPDAIRFIDITACNNAEEEAKKVISSEAFKNFDLNKGLMLRGVIIKTYEERFIFSFVIHHIISDGWSMWVIMKEISEIYNSLIAGQVISKPILPFQYSDYVSWQNSRLAESKQKDHQSYWMSVCSDELPTIDLPADFPRPLIKTYNGKRSTIHFNTDLSKRLNNASLQHGGSLFMMLLATVNTLLYKYTRQKDIIIGFPVAGRHSVDIEDQIGFYVNTLITRSKFTGTESFERLFNIVKENILDAIEHQVYSFDKLVGDLKLEADMSRSPLFDVMVVLQNFDSRDFRNIRMEGISLKNFPTPEGISRYDLTFNFVEASEIELTLEYNADLFTSDTINRLLTHYKNVVDIVTRDLSVTLDKIEYLSEFEQRQIKFDFNQPISENQWQVTIHELFEEQVRRSPDAIAVIFGDLSFTYKALNERSNQIACYLVSTFRIKAQECVAILMNRSDGFIQSVLGILKSGGICIPIDPHYPEERIRLMLDDASVKCILIDDLIFTERFKGFSFLSVTDHRVLNQYERKNVSIPVSFNDLAYIIYTSGSTGTPKGVMLEHRGIINHLYAKIQVCELDDESIIAQNSSQCFVVSIWQLLSGLLVGGKIVIYPSKALLEHGKFIQDLHKNKISILQVVPSYLSALLDYFGKESFQKTSLNLSYLLATGEPLQSGMVDNWFKYFPNIRLINAYGMSEGSDDVAHYVYNGGQQESGMIGKPVANMQIFILDSDMQICPVGVIGQICVAGLGVARGYLNQNEMTQKAFVNHSVIPGASMKVYQTGDLGKWTPDGNIVFIARKDGQVKIRGNRVELGEIENRLISHEDVKEAVVLAKENVSGEKYLVAYFTGSEDLQANKVSTWLKSYLPEFMIPSFLTKLDKIPVLWNGKTDRKLLQKLDEKTIQGKVDYPIASANAHEAQVTKIWKEVIGERQFNRTDDFFTVGGTSISFIRLLSSINSHFNINLKLPDIVSKCNVAHISSVISSLEKSDDDAFSKIVPDLANKHKPFPLNEIQQAYWIGRSEAFELGNVSTHVYTEYDFERLDLNRFNQALNQLTLRHDMLRAVINEDGEQRILPYEERFIHVLNLKDNLPEQIQKALMEIRSDRAQRILDYRHPLFIVEATLLPGDRTRIHMSVDLLIADAWSIKILEHDFTALYNTPQITLPPLDISFRDYLLAERDFKNTSIYKRSKEYWQQRLNQLPMAPQLPLYKPVFEINEPTYKNYIAELSPHDWDLLKRLADSNAISPTVFLLSAFSEILQTWSASPNFTLNLTLFNRLPFHKDVDGIVGDFTSVNLLAVFIDKKKTFLQRASALQHQVWQDVEHRYYSGIEVIRDLSRMNGNHGVNMPVVFTSTLSFNNKVNEFREEFFQEPVYSYSRTSQVWLDHQIYENEGALNFNWTVVEHLFPEGLIEEMFSAYCGLLKQLLSDPDAIHSTTFLLGNFNTTPNLRKAFEVPSHINYNLLTSFETYAKSYPDQIAIRNNEKVISYNELNIYSNKVAHWLLDHQVKTNTLVGILMEKGWEQVVAALGIIKSCAAYLPIDPTLPEERVRYLIEHSGVNNLLVQGDKPECIDKVQGLHLNILAIDDESLEELNASPVGRQPSPEDLAYVIFTSGSTGIPKGVMIDHRGAVNTIVDINKRFKVNDTDKVLAVSSLSFDLSVYDIFGSLAVGATIIIPDNTNGPDPGHWLELIHQEKISIWNSAPALMEAVIREADERSDSGLSDIESLRLVMLSGDWIPVDLPGKIKIKNNAIEVVSLGGATEASIWSIFYIVTVVDKSWKSIPYGKPLAHQNVIVYNHFMEECPTWVQGELYIGGIGLSKGYWADEEKTNQSFIIHPISGERLYKTGDIGRYLPDGNIEFLGRNDFQVKINGHRIELGEIETILRQHKKVTDAIVIPVKKNNVGKQLIAYVVQQYQQDENNINNLEERAALRFEKAPFYKIEQSGTRDVAKNIDPAIEWQNHKTNSLPNQIQSNHVLPERYVRLTLPAFSKWISCITELRLGDYPVPKYRYPSAGSLYPVQIYFYVGENIVDGLASGAYYYNPACHQCILVRRREELDDAISNFLSSFEILFSFVGALDAITPMYGKMSKDFCMLEAGYMAQELCMASENLPIDFLPAGFQPFHIIKALFSLQEQHGHLFSFKAKSKEGRVKGSYQRQNVNIPLELFNYLTSNQTIVKYQCREGLLINDKVERAAFKLKQFGIRHFYNNESTIVLPLFPHDHDLAKRYLSRQSFREFEHSVILLQDFSNFIGALSYEKLKHSFLFYNYQLINDTDSLIKIFLVLKENAVSGLEGGTYIYHQRSQTLNLVSHESEMLNEIHHHDNKHIYERASFSLFITADIDEVFSRLGKVGLDICLLQSGALGQLLMQNASEFLVGLCPIGAMNSEPLLKHFKSSSSDIVLHSFLGGKIHPQQLDVWNPMTSVQRSLKDELTAYLKEKLPHSSVPSYIKEVDNIPITVNGKVDRKALIALSKEFEEDKASLIDEVLTATEKTLVLIWQELLTLPVIRTQDNLLEIGCNSLLAIQAIARIHKKLDVKLDLRSIYTNPTIKQLSILIDQSDKTSYLGIDPIPEQKTYDLSHAQKRLWILDQFSDRQIAYNIQSNFILSGELDRKALQRALTSLIDRHEILRTTFVIKGDLTQQRINSTPSMGLKISYSDLRDAADADQTLKKLAEKESLTPFELSVGPLLRAHIVQLSEYDHAFLFTIHHIIADGWSMRILWRELMILYSAFKREMPNPLKPLRIQYRDYTVWQNKKILEGKDEQYWLSKFNKGTGLVEFVYDTQVISSQFNGKYESLTIGQEVVKALKDVAIKNRTSLSTVLFTIFNFMLQKLTGQSEISVALTVANRDNAELENMIGFFANMLIIRTDFTNVTSFEALLLQISDTTNEAMMHQSYPFDLLVERLNPERYSDNQPLFNVAFTFQNQESVHIDIPLINELLMENGESDLKATEFLLDNTSTIAKFDLLLFASESDCDLTLKFEYNSDRFESATIQNYLGYFKNIASSIVQYQ